MKGETTRSYRATPIDKPADSGEFVYGYLIAYEGYSFIFSYKDKKGFIHSFSEVHPSTIGQQIGEQDKHGKEIYAGDKVEIMTYYGRGVDENKGRMEIATNGCRCGLNTNGMVSIEWAGQKRHIPQLEIIGNIFDK